MKLMTTEMLDKILRVAFQNSHEGHTLHVSPSVAVDLTAREDWERTDQQSPPHGFLVGAYGFKLPVEVERDWNGSDALVVV